MEEIAEVYSRSLFDVAKEQGDLDRIHDELGEFSDALADNHDLQVFFFSPYFSSQEKKDGLQKLIQDDAKVDAKKYREELMESTRRDIEQETRRALEEIRKEVADLTIIATEKVTRKSLDADDQRRLIDEALSEVDFSALAGDENKDG